MSKTHTGSKLELHVKDFGPIVEAKIDLRPLTVFIGPGNTGKSYLAILIYALHRLLCNGIGPFGRFPEGVDVHDAEYEIGAVLESIKSVPGGSTIIPPTSVVELVRTGLHRIFSDLHTSLCHYFGTDNTQSLIRKGRTSAAQLMLRSRVSDDTILFEQELTLTRSAHPSETHIDVGVPLSISTSDADILRHMLHSVNVSGLSPESKANINQQFTQHLCDLFIPQLIGCLRDSAHFLPAGRTGIMQTDRAIVGAAIRSAASVASRSTDKDSMISGIIADFLSQLLVIDQSRLPPDELPRDLATNIEQSILAGTVGIDRSRNIIYPHFTYRPNGWKEDLPLIRASSMVSELAPIVLYLRHRVVPGNVLIIEEPEAHLHPAMQVKLIRQLAHLVNRGIRVIFTSHSEWILDALVNIVEHSKRPGVKGGPDDVSINPDWIGVWLFEPKKRPKGSIVRKIDIDISGLYPSGYNEVAVALHNHWVKITRTTEVSG